MKKELSKSEIAVADSTGATSVTVWEETIAKVCEEKSYLFSKLTVSFFFKKRYLNVTPNSKVDVCDDVSVSKGSSTAAEQLKRTSVAKLWLSM